MEPETKTSMDEADNVYRAIVEIAIQKGWAPRQEKAGDLHWAFAAGTFYTKSPLWNGDKIIVEQMGACSIEKLLFDHNFARITFGDDEFPMVLTSLAILPASERPEFLKLSYLMVKDTVEEKKVMDFATEV